MRSDRRGRNLRRIVIGIFLFAAFAAGVVTEYNADRAPAAEGNAQPQLEGVASLTRNVVNGLGMAAVCLPAAALLGSVLALRPRPRGVNRNPVVVQTQIVLSVVGALIMLVVGASLARAFGIVGVASLVRYRSRVDDPKDAVVMLSALGVGLACGVGLYFIAFFSTLFLVATLWLIESFEPEARVFELTVNLGQETAGLRSAVERILRRSATTFELRSSSNDETTYLVRAPQHFSTVEVTEAIAALATNGKAAVEWSEKSKLK